MRSEQDEREIKALLGPWADTFEVKVYERPVKRRQTVIVREGYDDAKRRSPHLEATGGEAARGALAFSDETELGRDGLWWIAGLPHKDRNPRFAPVIARGCQYDHGDFYQLFIGNTDYRRGVEDRAASLSCGTWRVELPKKVNDLPQYAQKVAEKQRAFVEDRLDLESQSWLDHVHDSLYQMVSGFSLFEKVWRGDGSCKLSFRWPHTVDEWILDEAERDWVAVKLYEQRELLPRSRALHYRYGGFGMDPEGIAPMRSVALLIELGQSLLRTGGVAANAFGIPRTFVEQAQQNADTKDDARLVGALMRPAPGTPQVYQLKYGAKVVMLSPSGTMPDVLALVRYCDEKISQLLNAEGALLGQRGVGSLALAEQRDSERLSSAYHWGDRIARTISEQVIREMITRQGWLPVAPGCWPRLVFDLGLEDDKTTMADLVAGVQAGLILPTDEVITQMHERADLDTAGLAQALAERRARADQAAQQLAGGKGQSGASQDKKEGEAPGADEEPS